MRSRFVRHARQSCRAACLLIRVVDPHWFNADPDPDPKADPEPGLWWPKIEKIYSWKLFIFLIKNCIYLSLNPPKGRPSYWRSLQPSKKSIHHFKTWSLFSIFWGDFCLPGSGSVFCMRIRIQRLKLTRIHIPAINMCLWSGSRIGFKCYVWIRI